MAIVLCMDGLGGRPETTFGLLKLRLERDGHRVVLIDTKGIVTHEDRVRLVMEEFWRNQTVTQMRKIVLIGQSAGGSAVRIAAERLCRSDMYVSGVVLLSPAMPFGVWFMTAPLWQVMKNRLGDILKGRMVHMTEYEYELLTAPLNPDSRDQIIRDRQPVSGVEARTLALCPPAIRGHRYPTLHVYGDQDGWISPSAQRKLSRKLLSNGPTTVRRICGAGHLVLASRERYHVIREIQHWIKRT